MRVFVIRAPQALPGDRPLYFSRFDESGRIAVTHHTITARRFPNYGLALEFAASRRELAEWTVLRQP